MSQEAENDSSEGDNIKQLSGESTTHSEEKSGDGSAAFYVNHGQQTREVALSGSSKEQSIKDSDAVGTNNISS